MDNLQQVVYIRKINDVVWMIRMKNTKCHDGWVMTMMKNGNFSHWVSDDFDEGHEVLTLVGDDNDEEESKCTHVR